MTEQTTYEIKITGRRWDNKEETLVLNFKWRCDAESASYMLREKGYKVSDVLPRHPVVVFETGRAGIDSAEAFFG